MLTDNRKRHCSCDSIEDQQLIPQAKRSGRGPCPLESDLDSEVTLKSSLTLGLLKFLGHGVSQEAHRSECFYPPPMKPSSLPSVLQSSSSDSSNGVSSPERAIEASTRPCIHSRETCSSTTRRDPASSMQHGLHGDGQRVSYVYINRVLREAHFSSLQTRGRQGST